MSSQNKCSSVPSACRRCVRRPASRFASPEIHYTHPVPKKLSTRHLGRACLFPIGRCQTAPTHISSIAHAPLHISIHSPEHRGEQSEQARRTHPSARQPWSLLNAAHEKSNMRFIWNPNFATTVDARCMRPHSLESHCCAVCISFHFARICNRSNRSNRSSRRNSCDEAEVERRNYIRDGLEEDGKFGNVFDSCGRCDANQADTKAVAVDTTEAGILPPII